MTATWSIVATVDEPAQLVAAFVAHHLAIGASAVDLFLDKPCEETQDLLRAFPECRVTVCNATHWLHHHGMRPGQHTRRQGINANIAYARSTADWILHCDADEFVRDGAALVAELPRFRQSDVHVRLGVAERVQPAGEAQAGLFEGIFRLPSRVGFEGLDGIYFPVTGFLDRGLTGHPTGKALVRTGRGLKLSIHQPAGDIPSKPIRSTRLLHFDGMTPFHYLLKLLRRAHEKQVKAKSRHKPGRLTQLTAIKENSADMAFCDQIVAALKTLTEAQVAPLTALNLLDFDRFEPSLGTLQVDLSVEAFDAALKQRFAAFLARNAPALL